MTENRKYEFTGKTREIEGRVLHQIRALRELKIKLKGVASVKIKTGQLGGFIENESNLSHDGNCWVNSRACVYGNAQISGDARVFDYAEIYDCAQIRGNAGVKGHAKVFGNAVICDTAVVGGHVKVFGCSQIFGSAFITAPVKIFGFSQINAAWVLADTE